MFFLESALVWCGMRRYSSKRMTDGMGMRRARGVQRKALLLFGAGNALEHEHQGASCTADVDGFIRCIQHQHRRL